MCVVISQVMDVVVDYVATKFMDKSIDGVEYAVVDIISDEVMDVAVDEVSDTVVDEVASA